MSIDLTCVVLKSDPYSALTPYVVHDVKNKYKIEITSKLTRKHATANKNNFIERKSVIFRRNKFFFFFSSVATYEVSNFTEKKHV